MKLRTIIWVTFLCIASFSCTEEDKINNEMSTMMDAEIDEVENELQGIIVTTSDYALTGSYTVEHIEDEGIIRISIQDNYIADDSLPGLYLYVTNDPNSISDAFEVGAVTVFNGAHVYDIPDDQISIEAFTYLLYWCKPFSVKVGEGSTE